MVRKYKIVLYKGETFARFVYFINHSSLPGISLESIAPRLLDSVVIYEIVSSFYIKY